MTSTHPGRAYGYRNAEPSHSQVYLNPKLMRIIDSRTWPSPAKALDYGCGNGWLADRLADRGFAATGVDISSSGIDVARRYFPRVDFTSDTSADSLSQRGPFDLVTCIEVIAHCFTPIDELARIRASMKSSGILILSTPYHGYFKFLALAASGRMEQHLDTSWSGAYVHHYTPRSISKVLDGAGLEVLAIERAGRIPTLAKSMIVTCRKR
jgi:2-polyprenyl-3-methyl-5-hydroxy-6-metoxy-1,4-benzoquinol methylase